MEQQVRAYDFEVQNGNLILGQRVVSVDELISFHMDKRISVEMIGFALVLVVCLVLLTVGLRIGVNIVLLIVIGVAFFGIKSELGKPFVLSLDLHQLGRCEVRGFNRAQATELELHLFNLRGRSS